jgi:hypothetical protein
VADDVWQFSAGDGVRDYGDVCVQFGVAMVGPGDPGPYPDHREHYLHDEHDFRPWMQTFCEADVLQEGHLIALKRPKGGRWVVPAVGQVSGGYRWLEQFADVDGWNLQHTRGVKWRTPPRGNEIAIDGLRRGTLTRTKKAADAVRSCYERWKPHPADPLPEPAKELKDEELTEELLKHGMPIVQCDRLVETMNRLRRLAGWYKTQGAAISEHEIRTFLIVPVLQALGWPEQRTKIELRPIDIALFDKPYTDTSEPSVIVESKRPDAGLRWTIDQATGYAKRYPGCRALVVTDGFRYELWERGPNKEWKEGAYVSLLRPLRRHPYRADVGGAAELFERLLAPQMPLR